MKYLAKISGDDLDERIKNAIEHEISKYGPSGGPRYIEASIGMGLCIFVFDRNTNEYFLREQK